MNKAFASIKRGLKQAIRPQKRKRAGEFEPGPKDNLLEFVRKSPLTGAALDIRRKRDADSKAVRPEESLHLREIARRLLADVRARIEAGRK